MLLDTGLLLAVMLLAALAGGYIAKWVHIPRIIGYLVAGMCLKQVAYWSYGGEAASAQVKSLEIVNELALGLILFTIGEVFDRRRLKAIWRSLLRLSCWEVGLTFLLTAVGCAVVTLAVPGMTFGLSIAVGLLLGMVAIATAPAATYLVLREYDAKGPTTDKLLGMTGINNLISIIGFGAVFILCSGLGWIEGSTHGSGKLLLNLFLSSLGSIAIGIVLGFVLSVVHSRLPLPEMIILFFGLLFLLSAGDSWLHSTIGVTFNPMVVCLAMGAVFANLALDSRALEQTLATVSVPVFALFFVLAGYNLHLEELPHLGALGVAYVVLRSGGKILGIRMGVHRLGSSAMISRNAGLALLCQAGVAIGLGAFLVNYWVDASGEPNPLARKINTVILASVALYEIIGPWLVKVIAVRAGEVRLVSLLRPGALPGNMSGPAIVLWDKIRRLFGKFKKKSEMLETLTARHLMRTNVRLLPVEANLDEVLHFIERSHLSDFPVTDSNGGYVGIVHFQAIRDMMYDPTLAYLVTAFDLAEYDAPTVTPDTTLGELLEIFHEHDLGSLPVVADRESNQLIGIVEQRDLLKTFYRDTAQNNSEG